MSRVRKSQTACDKKIVASIVALHNISTQNVETEPSQESRPTKLHTSRHQGYQTYTAQLHKMHQSHLPNARNNFTSPIAMSEKKAPSQSIVKNPKSMPTTRPLLFHNSNGTGVYPIIKSTAATTPTSVTGHDTPRRYGARMTNIKSASMPAKKSASAVASRVVVQTRHLLHLDRGY